MRTGSESASHHIGAVPRRGVHPRCCLPKPLTKLATQHPSPCLAYTAAPHPLPRPRASHAPDGQHGGEAEGGEGDAERHPEVPLCPGSAAGGLPLCQHRLGREPRPAPGRPRLSGSPSQRATDAQAASRWAEVCVRWVAVRPRPRTRIASISSNEQHKNHLRVLFTACAPFCVVRLQAHSPCA